MDSMSDDPIIPPGIVPDDRDMRRAAALMIHANPDRTDPAGIAAIVAEIKGDLRITEALCALVILAYATEKQLLSSDEGQAGLRAIIAANAARENKGDKHE